MKKFIILTTVITALAIAGYGQVDTSAAKLNSQYTKDQYLVKAKHQKTAAWICVGGGLALVTTGIILSSPKIVADYSNIYTNIFTTTKTQPSNYTGETILMLVGMAGMATSIPLFIASGKNKHKANLMLTIQKTSEKLPVMVAKNITGLTVSISL